MSCSGNPAKPVAEKNIVSDTIKKQGPEPVAKEPKEAQTHTSPKINTTTPEGKAAQLLANLKDSIDYAAFWGKDTLIDLNGDGHRDLLLEFYGSSGTGLKNRVNIYLFNNKKLRFLKEPIDLPNPTFNFRNNTIVSYYVANGGGYATELKWHGLRLDTIESIEVNIHVSKEFKATAIIHNHLTGKETKKTTDMVWLPDKYKYWNYTPIIRRE